MIALVVAVSGDNSQQGQSPFSGITLWALSLQPYDVDATLRLWSLMFGWKGGREKKKKLVA